MKVAFLTTDSREHFKDYGNPQPYFGTAPQALLEGFELLPKDVEVHVICCLQEAPISSPGRLAANIYYHALHVPKIGWLKTGYQGCIRAVRRKLKQIQPDIVHGQGTERDCAICASLSGFPNVLTIHGVMRAIFQLTNSKPLSYYWFAKHLETFALRNANGVIAISPYVDELVSPFTPRTWFIPNALRSFFFAPAPLLARNPGPPRLVNVGVISPRKRQVELLEYFSRLRESAAFTVTFIGKADRGCSYTERFLGLLDSTNARHGGFIHRESLSQEGLIKLYDESDAMVHFSSEESFGLTFAEALARYLPLFASDVGAIRQIAEDVEECRIFAPDDFGGLLKSLEDWIQRFGGVSQRLPPPNEVIASRYQPIAVAKRHLKVYGEVTGKWS